MVLRIRSGRSQRDDIDRPDQRASDKRRSIVELAEKLAAMGIPETERNIANKISRGGFTAVFFIQCLEAIGAREVLLRHD